MGLPAPRRVVLRPPAAYRVAVSGPGRRETPFGRQAYGTILAGALHWIPGPGLQRLPRVLRHRPLELPPLRRDRRDAELPCRLGCGALHAGGIEPGVPLGHLRRDFVLQPDRYV